MQHRLSKDMKRCNHLQSEIDAVYHEASLKFGLSDSESIILYTLCSYDGVSSVSNVVQISGLSKQTVSSSLHKMEREGIVILESDGPKTKKVCLTEKGRKLSDNTIVRLFRAEDEVFLSWSREDVEKYIELTARFLSDMKEKINNL